MIEMKYTFFDVETANFNQSSICSIGYIVLEDGKIINKGYYLVKPEPFYMDYYNTQIHGITEEMVKNEPTFDIIWDKIKEHFNNTTLIAHFSQFDMKCLRDALDTYNMEYPNAEYSCTYALSRRGVKGLFNYKLDTLADYYNIQFDHHNALEDTQACYEVLINVLKDNNTNDIEELHNTLKVKKGWIKSTGEWKGFQSVSLNGKNSRIDISKIKATVENIDQDNEFYGKEIVFTGTLERVTRKDAMQIVVNLGGIPDDKVNKNTDYLIIGKSDFIDFKNGKKTNKLKKAEELIQNGQELEIIDETDFYRMIGEEANAKDIENSNINKKDIFIKSESTEKQEKNRIKSALEYIDGKDYTVLNGHYTDYIDDVKCLKLLGKDIELEKLLFDLILKIEEESKREKWCCAPWYYEQLAIIYRKNNRVEEEIKILDRYLNNDLNKTNNHYNKLLDRREKILK